MTAPDPPRSLRVVQIVTTLARGGAQATVLASSDSSTMAAIDPGLDVRVVAGLDGTGEGSHWDDPDALAGLDLTAAPDLVRSIRPGADQRALRWLIGHLRTVRPDVVHTHSSKAGVLGRLAARAAGYPVVHTVHGWGPIDASRGPVRSAAIGIERLLAPLSTALVVVGRSDLEVGLDRGIGRPDQYHVVRSGIELATTPDATVRDRLRRDLGLDGRFVIGMVGRLATQKDQAGLMAAFRRAVDGATGSRPPAGPDDPLARATLVLIGDGPRRRELEDQARSTGGDIRILGARPDGADVVAAFDLAVNHARWEGLPRTVVEAAAAGVPVIATDVGATAELIDGRDTGWLVPSGDVAALAGSIAEVVGDPAEAARRAELARGRTAEFSADRMRRDLVGLWRSVADPGVRPTVEPAGRVDLAPLPRRGGRAARRASAPAPAPPSSI